MLSAGCVRKDVLVKQPDSPMLLVEVRGKVLVAVYDEQTNTLVQYGWVVPEAGWTISKFDWEAYKRTHGTGAGNWNP